MPREDLWSGKGRGHASVEMVQEVVHHRLRRGDRVDAVCDARDMSELLILLDLDHEILDRSLELIETTQIRGRDAVHATTALAYGIAIIASADPAFDGIPGLTRVDPTVA